MIIELKITGAGTREEIVNRLEEYANLVRTMSEDAIKAGYYGENKDLSIHLEEDVDLPW